MEEDEEEATSSSEEIETENFESAAKDAIQSMSIDKQVDIISRPKSREEDKSASSILLSFVS